MIKVNIIDAILKINPNAKVVVRGTDINTCILEWYEGTTPISKSEIEAMIPVVEAELAAEAQAKIDNQASANAKLKALGLTDDEIKALIG